MLIKPRSTLLVIGPGIVRQTALSEAFAAYGTTVIADITSLGWKRAQIDVWASGAEDPPSLILVTSLALMRRNHIQAAIAVIPERLRLNVMVVFGMAGPSAVEHVRATMSGAVDVIDTDSGAHAVAARCHALIEQERNRTVMAVAGTSQVTLAALLDAAAGGKPFDLASSERTAGLMIDAIKTHGVERWMTTVAQCHSPTYRHSLLMAGITAGFMVALGVGERDSSRLTSAALVHDIGKALLPAAILDKPGRLSAEEFALVRNHPGWGYDMLRSHGDADPTQLSVTRHHHEFLDGSGYPDGLTHQGISDIVRISTICDVFTAMIEPRSYKVAMGVDEALLQLRMMEGKLDPDLLTIFAQRFAPHVPVLPLSCGEERAVGPEIVS